MFTLHPFLMRPNKFDPLGEALEHETKPQSGVPSFTRPHFCLMHASRVNAGIPKSTSVAFTVPVLTTRDSGLAGGSETDQRCSRNSSLNCLFLFFKCPPPLTCSTSMHGTLTVVTSVGTHTPPHERQWLILVSHLGISQQLWANALWKGWDYATFKYVNIIK